MSLIDNIVAERDGVALAMLVGASDAAATMLENGCRTGHTVQQWPGLRGWSNWQLGMDSNDGASGIIAAFSVGPSSIVECRVNRVDYLPSECQAPAPCERWNTVENGDHTCYDECDDDCDGSHYEDCDVCDAENESCYCDRCEYGSRYCTAHETNHSSNLYYAN